MKKINIKRMLGVVGLLAVAVPATLSVVACGTNTKEIKIPLTKVFTNLEVDGSKFNTAELVLTEVISLNSNSGVTVDDVEVQDFVPADYGVAGSAIIKAVASSKFTGAITIKITARPKLVLANAITNKTIIGVTNIEDVIFAVLEVNKNSDVQINDLEVTNFSVPEIGTPGSATIKAVASSKYTGEVVIIIEKTIDEQIVDAINLTNYIKKVNFKSSISELKSTINTKFISTKLNDKIKNAFEESKFTLNNIFNENNIALTNQDFETVGTINAKINYSYGSITNQTATLIITVDEAEISDKFELNDGNVNTLLQATNGKLYAGTDNGNIWEINLNDNQANKKFALDGNVNILIQATNGKLYAGTINNNVWEIDLENNSAQLKFEKYGDNKDTTTLIEGNNGKLYAGTAIGNVFELDLATNLIHKYRLEDYGVVNALFQASNGKLYAGTTEGKIWEIDLESNETNLDIPLFDNGRDNIILDMKEIAGNKLVLTTKNKIYQFDLDTNQIAEIFNLNDGEIFALVQSSSQELYVATINGNVFELDLETRQVKNKYEINTSIYSLIIIDKMIYAGTKTSVWELAIV